MASQGSAPPRTVLINVKAANEGNLREAITVELYDPGSKQQMSKPYAVRTDLLEQAHGAFLVFDLSNRNSF